MGADFWIMATLFVGAMLMMRLSARATVQAPRERPGHAYRQMLLDRAMRGEGDEGDAGDGEDDDSAGPANEAEPPPDDAPPSA
jgi:hypothetical protein